MWSRLSSITGSLPDLLKRINELLKDALQERNSEKALKLCDKVKSKLEDAEKIFAKKNTNSPAQDDGIANAYHSLGGIFDGLQRPDMAKESYAKASEWGYINEGTPQIVSPRPGGTTGSAHSPFISVAASIATPSIFVATSHDVSDPTVGQLDDGNISHQTTSCIENQSAKSDAHASFNPQAIFTKDVVMPVDKYGLPEDGAPITSTLQLAYYLSLLQPPLISTDSLDASEENSTKSNIVINPDEQDRLRTISTNMVRAFIRDDLKKPDIMAEIVCLATVLDREDFQELLHAFVNGIEHSVLLKDRLLDGLAQLMSNAPPGYIESDDLVKILSLLKKRLEETHQQSTRYMYQLATTVSRVLDSMVDSHVVDLKREQLHAPLSEFLKQLQDGSDSALVYQSAYAYQALEYIPNDENLLQEVVRRTGKVLQGVSGILSAVKALDVAGLFKGVQDIQKGVTGVYDAIMFANDTYINAKKLYESGKDFKACLQEGLSFSRKSGWYPVLRVLDVQLQQGRLMEFEKTIRKAPCRIDPAFQWGVCQRLGEIVVNQVWDTDIRKSAIDFLRDIYKDDARWGRQADVKQWILYILRQSTESPDTIVSGHARELLVELKTNGNAKKQALLQVDPEEHHGTYQLMPILPPEKSPLLQDVQDNPDIEAILCRIRRERRKKNDGDVYISPMAKANLRAEESFDLTSKVQEFIKSEKMVFLLLGDSGAGKSTFNKALEASLWEDYKKDGRIPLFIHLPSIDKPEHDLVDKQLLKYGFSSQQIQELKSKRKFILICDGYDESQQTGNMYTKNQLNQPLGWHAQMIISCRTEYIGATYKNRFQPSEGNSLADSVLFQEAVVAPFNDIQIQNYIDQYVSSSILLWESNDYNRALKNIPNLKDLVTNPFLLQLALSVLPTLVDKGSDFPTVRITRVELYDKFLYQWIERNETRLGGMPMSPHDKGTFERLSTLGFKPFGVTYFKELAAAIYDKQDGIPVVNYSEPRDRKTWKEPFFNRRDNNKLLLESVPLVRIDNQYRFIHKSVLEYGLSLAVFDPDVQEEDAEPEPSHSRLGSTRSVQSITTHPIIEEAANCIEELLKSPLGRRNLVGEPSILQFLVERVQQKARFKNQLHAVIHRSKSDETAKIAAANAITVLVRAKVQFLGVDFRGIKIPGADLSHGVFDSVQLEGADLQNVFLRSVWLRNSSLSGAQMMGVQFGELPFLQEDTSVESCAYSPDGKVFAVGLRSGNISLYETSSWSRIRTLEGHTNQVESLEFSPTSNELVSGSDDRTVRLWDVTAGCCTQTLKGHEGFVFGVVYLRNGDRIASGSWDQTVRLWDCKTGECVQTLKGHDGSVHSIAYSSSRNQLASGSFDKTVRLWDAETGHCMQTLKGHSDRIWSVAYSPNGDLVASGSLDRTVMLWDVVTGECIQTIQGHSGHVYSVVFSPKGDLIASGSQDMTMRLWDVETGKCVQTLQGHTEYVPSVVFSPNGNQIASGSADQTVRLWDVESGKHIDTLQEHGVLVDSVVYSPNGNLIASGNLDGTMSLWDIETGNCVHTLLGHNDDDSLNVKDSVPRTAIAFSPKGDLIAIGCKDHALRLWNTSTRKYIQVIPNEEGAAIRVVFSPNGSQIASLHGNTLQLWDVETGSLVHALQGHSEKISRFAYSPQGDRIASGSTDGTVRLWDVVNGTCIHTLEGHGRLIYSVAFSPKGDQIASGNGDNTVKLWDVETGNYIFNLEGHDDHVISVVYSPKGDRIVSGNLDKAVRLWNTETGECLRTLESHSGAVWHIMFSPNGDLIASASQDKTIRLWSTETGQCLTTIFGFSAPVTNMVWESNGQYLVTGSLDRSVRRWQIIKKDEEYKVLLCWSSSHVTLTASGASFDGVDGLSQVDMKLLSQCGALITPSPNPES